MPAVGVQCVHELGEWHHRATDYLNQGAALCDRISSKLNSVITSIDGEIFSGDEKELVIYDLVPQPLPPLQPQPAGRGILEPLVGHEPTSQGAANNAMSTIVTSPSSSNYFAKVNLYANSRLPRNLPPLKV
jgi:hypothetical protein